MTHAHYHSSVVITVLRCITGCSCLTGLAVVSVVAEVSGATSQGESWLRLGTDPLELVCLLAMVAVPALGDSCNIWEHSSLNYQPTDADTSSETPYYYALHCAIAAAIRTVAWGKMQSCPIWAIHSRFTLHFPANGNVFHHKLHSSLYYSQFRVKTNWKNSWEKWHVLFTLMIRIFLTFSKHYVMSAGCFEISSYADYLNTCVSLVLCLWSALAYRMLPPKGMSIQTEQIHTAGAHLCQLYYLTVSIRPDQDLSPLSFPWFWMA
jgi:hypothetical protein